MTTAISFVLDLIFNTKHFLEAVQATFTPSMWSGNFTGFWYSLFAIGQLGMWIAELVTMIAGWKVYTSFRDGIVENTGAGEWATNPQGGAGGGGGMAGFGGISGMAGGGGGGQTRETPMQNQGTAFQAFSGAGARLGSST